MSWCDKLASRPAVGISFKKHFRPSSEILSALIPVLDELGGQYSDRFTLTKQDSFSLEFTTESGFKYGVDPARVSVEFQHRVKVKETSGSLPIMEFLSKQEPYTHMLTDVARRTLEAVELIGGGTRILEKVGVVSHTVINEKDAPPGIQRAIRFFSRPWAESVQFYNFQIIATLDENEEWEDRCIHHFIKQEAEEPILNLSFDYQRKFKTRRLSTSTRSAVAGAQEAALAYFEDLAQGDRFDEHDGLAAV